MQVLLSPHYILGKLNVSDYAKDLRYLLSIRPPPIIDAQNKLVLLWNAKAGCTFTIKWLFYHMGILQQAVSYHNWIHKYRDEKLLPSREYRTAIKNFCDAPSSYRLIKFVRDPYKRTVSSYIHSQVFGYTDAAISKFLKRNINKTQRFTFREFISYLESINLKKCNPHHCIQTHELERCDIPSLRFIIDLDHSMEELPKLEGLLGLPQSNLQDFKKSSHHTHKDSNHKVKFYGDFHFDIFHKVDVIIPDYQMFYDLDLEKRVYDLYTEDFSRYKFPTILNDT